jgi:hypothetical protein
MPELTSEPDSTGGEKKKKLATYHSSITSKGLNEGSLNKVKQNSFFRSHFFSLSESHN